MSDPIKEIEAFRQKFIDTYFTRQQAADLLDEKVKTMDKWRDIGYGPPAYKASNGRIYYKIAELREWALRDPEMVEKFAAEDAKNQANLKDPTPA